MGELKNIYLNFFGGGTVVRWADSAKNELSKMGTLHKTFLFLLKSRDFFQPSYTNTYGGAKKIYDFFGGWHSGPLGGNSQKRVVQKWWYKMIFTRERSSKGLLFTLLLLLLFLFLFFLFLLG
jgi:hypothetical protein